MRSFDCKGWHSFDQVRRPYRGFSYRMSFHRKRWVLPEVDVAFRAVGFAQTTAKRQRGFAPVWSVSGRWPSPFPPWPWPVARLTCVVFPTKPHGEIRGISVQPSWSWSLFRSCGASAPARSHELSLLRFVECASLPVSLQPSAPSVQAHLRTAGANRRSCSVLVVSHHLDGFLRLQICGLVASRYQLEVRRFSGFPARHLPKQVGWAPRTPSQATLLTPFGVFPSPVAVPRHHLRSPRPRRNASQAALDVHQRPLPSCCSFTPGC